MAESRNLLCNNLSSLICLHEVCAIPQNGCCVFVVSMLRLRNLVQISKRDGQGYSTFKWTTLWRVLALSPLRSSLKLILHLHGLFISSLPKEINHKLYSELSKKHLLEIYACGNNKQGCFGCGVLGG